MSDLSSPPASNLSTTSCLPLKSPLLGPNFWIEPALKSSRLQDWQKLTKYGPAMKHGGVCPSGIPTQADHGDVSETVVVCSACCVPLAHVGLRIPLLHVSNTQCTEKFLENDLFSGWKCHVVSRKKSKSSFWANSGFPHLTNNQHTQESSLPNGSDFFDLYPRTNRSREYSIEIHATDNAACSLAMPFPVPLSHICPVLPLVRSKRVCDMLFARSCMRLVSSIWGVGL